MDYPDMDAATRRFYGIPETPTAERPLTVAELAAIPLASTGRTAEALVVVPGSGSAKAQTWKTPTGEIVARFYGWGHEQMYVFNADGSGFTIGKSFLAVPEGDRSIVLTSRRPNG